MFFTHDDWFTPSEYGLTRSLLDISLLVCAFSTLGVTSYLFKFFPYYKDNLKDFENDLLSIAIVVAICGFIVTALSLLAMEPLIYKKLNTNSPLLVSYFYFCLPIAFFILLYNILEAYAYGFGKGVFTSFLREVVLRFFVFVAIVLKVLHIISFEQFMWFFAFQYVIIVVILAFYLNRKNQLWLSFKISRVSRKFRKKIIAILSLTFLVIIVGVLRQAIDSLVLAARLDLSKVGIFGFAAYMVSVLQAPFRSMVAITLPILSRSWKDKNIKEINRIYNRSSINLLTFALFVFVCIWLNFDVAVTYFNLNPSYLEGKWVFFILGLVTIIEMGTGVSGQIIGTSTYWRFELWTSILLTALIIPLSYVLTITYGLIGPALANLISFSIYNAIRMWFLYKKFNMQPFSKKTVEVLLLAITGFFVTWFVCQKVNGMSYIILSLGLFSIIFLPYIYFRNVSPDIKPVVNSVRKRIRQFKSN